MEYVIYTIAFTIWINALLWIDVILGKSWLYTLIDTRLDPVSVSSPKITKVAV